MDNAILHINYTSVTQYLEKFNRYTTADANKMYDAGRSFRWHRLFTAPAGEFWRRYVRYQGYRDGEHGLILCLLQAFYAMVSQIKLWEMTQFGRADTINKQPATRVTQDS